MANKMWGGRFQTSPADVMERINASIDFDQRLYEQDIAASIAHCKMLGDTGILTADEVEQITNGLRAVKAEIDAGTFTFSKALEDIHMNVESRLKDLIGPVAGKLHTARSRNDQVATDFRLHLRDWADRFDGDLKALQLALARKAVDYAGMVMPGFTHLQMAQPVTFGHHLLAYVEMVGRDRGRLMDARARMNESPLGAAALAGTSFPIDRAATAKALGFDGVMRNSLDAVSDRDFVLELLASCVIGAVHLSRLAEEIVLWCSAQFRFVTLSDRYTTGSSIMPQKRNPDAAELTRAKVGRILGAFTAVSVVMKGLPLAYSKDMQEDKETTFDALESYAIAIAAMTGMIDDLVANEASMRAGASLGFATATDLADWLVRRLGMPFREAHHVTGRLVGLAEQRGIDLSTLPLADMQAVEPRITGEVFEVLTVDASVRSRTSAGGTAPDLVRQEALRWVKALEG